jgi:hypothetical protein
MAQGDTWINIGLSSTAGDVTKQKHSLIGGASGVGDVSFIFDGAKLAKNLNLADVLLAQIRSALVSSGFK